MERTKFQRLCALFLAMLMLIPGSIIVATANDGETSTSTSVTDKTIADVREQLNAISYAEYSEKYSSVKRAEAEITIEGTNYNKEATTAEVSVGTYDGVEALYTPGSGVTSWNVKIDKTAKYSFEIGYYGAALRNIAFFAFRRLGKKTDRRHGPDPVDVVMALPAGDFFRRIMRIGGDDPGIR